jgi:hypothetical protein
MSWNENSLDELNSRLEIAKESTSLRTDQKKLYNQKNMRTKDWKNEENIRIHGARANVLISIFASSGWHNLDSKVRREQ